MFSIYIACIVLLNIPVVQKGFGNLVSNILEKEIGAKVKLERIDLGILNRLIIDNVEIYDQKQKLMLSANRVSTKISVLDLFHGKINISSAQLFGMHVYLYQNTPKDKLNCQFLIDVFKSKDNTTSGKPVDFSLGALVIRNGNIQFDKWFVPEDKTQNKLDANHLSITHLNAHIGLEFYPTDSVIAQVKSLSLNEKSGLIVNSLRFRLFLGKGSGTLQDFYLALPKSFVDIKQAEVRYPTNKQLSLKSKLQFKGSISKSRISPKDFSFLSPVLKQYEAPVYLHASLKGNNSKATIAGLSVRCKEYGLNLEAMATSYNPLKNGRWAVKLKHVEIQQKGIDELIKIAKLPSTLHAISWMKAQALFSYEKNNVILKGNFSSALGRSKFFLSKLGRSVDGSVQVEHFNMDKLINTKFLGDISTTASFKGIIDKTTVDVTSNGRINGLSYNNYKYKDIIFKGRYQKSSSSHCADVNINLDDPNGVISLEGKCNLHSSQPNIQATMHIQSLNLSALKLYDKLGTASIDADIETRFNGSDIKDATGYIDISNFKMRGGSKDYTMNTIHFEMGKEKGNNYASFLSDFGRIYINGNLDYSQLPYTVFNLIGDKLPTIPGLPKSKATNNNFHITAHINNSDFLAELCNFPIILRQPADLTGDINDKNKKISLDVNLPHFEYDNNTIENGRINISSPNDTLQLKVSFQRVEEKGHKLSVAIDAAAVHNNLLTKISFDNGRAKRLRGYFDAQTYFFLNKNKQATAHVKVLPSNIMVSDSVWQVEPSDIIYSKNHLTIDHFAVQHNRQHIIVSGLASNSRNDKLTADLKEVDLSYILNLVNFHAVSFSGKASGTAEIVSAFRRPEATANLQVEDFKFEDGRMGDLQAMAVYDNTEGKINLKAIAQEDDRKTFINGYVSPKNDNINLEITAQDTNIEFLKSFCGSFMSNIEASASGKVRVAGPLSAINLSGELVANGSLRITPTNTTYRLVNDTIRMIPDKIILARDTVYDKDGNIGVINGVLRHHDLTQLTYDLNINAKNLLSYDTHGFGDNTFYGTAYTTGTCHIYEHNGEITIDIDVLPEKGSQFVYNTTSPGGVDNQQFIHWLTEPDAEMADTGKRQEIRKQTDDEEDEDSPPSDIHINFLINMTPHATLKLLMDEKTGDYIALSGNGALRATYFNKGRFNMYGNYVIDHGIYKLTIQNIIKKEFQFNPNGSIAFGGDPYDATLDLKAQYIVPAVSLSDLNLAQNITTNNIRVNCIMNITGTPAYPKIDFSLDMPSLDNEAKRMVFSIINSENEMNQQVLYLLAVGRFYSQRNNNNSEIAPGAQQSQTSLAMQSILSGTVSQQINNVISSLSKNDNWNFGANISTGNEGWNNAEYEGLLSGRLLNNRLLINGQFGYRDNPKTSTSFIGDFEAKYLLAPGGNYAIRVYNQSNDRYFTRNSLNTQGIGFVIKKEFDSWKSLFRKKKKKK
ncbi:translocation/assembly module TamB [Prevotella sp. A2931]|uniref:Translocation/assembly module TamB n=1 Tax=Prevotella illustrans TaxID=2800387 RepID=A0ABS3M2T0_9BACT|nr:MULTISPECIES: translocation/assembly module TamB domain-containing protein [Prevotella]MBO1362405.1 translocation/assembly module TamB [Prevotella illustrans]